MRAMVFWMFSVVFAVSFSITLAFNGEQAEQECPDDCDCHYFRINWVTDCSESNLTEIPYDELSLNVYVLDLNDNFIAFVKPFPPNIKIRRLQLANNFMTEVRKDSYVGLNLIDADFSGNRIAKVDPHAFEDMPGFITLELQNNPLEPVDGPFLSINSLIYLDLSNCSLKYLNLQFFDNITTLTTLDLSDNPLNTIDNKVFKLLNSLETLKMNHCNLTRIDDDAFDSLTNLINLELRGNNLLKSNWPLVLDHLIRLEYLDLKKSHIDFIPESGFSNNLYLRTLILAENNLADLDVSTTIGKLQQLDTLDLSHCNLTLPLSEDAFHNATKIKNLYLSGNTLFASDLLVALSPLTHLEKLSLSECGLRRLPDTFHNFKSLQELDISHNPLNDAFVKLLAPLETLEYLNMGYSNLSILAPTSFSKMTSMRRLVLSGNDLNNLEAGLFGNLTRLESLELNFCGLRRSLNATLFFNNFTYTDLTELQLAGNPLRVSKAGPLLPKQLSRLQTLDLSNCNLTFLPPDAFYWTRNITNLVLSGNHFTTPNDFRFLEMLPKLELLDLRYNKLTTFSPKEFATNPMVEKLKLIGNPWICDCSVAELWDWALIEKGDLSILEGSTSISEHAVVSKTNKRKKLLICNYDTTTQPLPIVINKTVSGRRPFIKSQRILSGTNRTWAKYVRESNCEPLPKLKRAARAVERFLSEGVTMRFAPHVPNTWATAAINAVVVYITLMALIGIGYVVVKRRATIQTNVLNEKYN